MSNEIKTRIKNKVDYLAKWSNSAVELLDGEIAIVRVPTGETHTNPVTGKSEPVTALLMKIGDGSSSFADLPWLSAKAADVYTWAKNEKAVDIPVTVGSTQTTLGAYLAKIDTNGSDISANNSAISGIKNNYLRVDDNNQLVHYQNGSETEIIFDCGGAPID